jgi:FKBP-type peptidyl-prolyl cis-trans isomerase FkpA
VADLTVLLEDRRDVTREGEVLILVACGSDSPTSPRIDQTTFAPELEIDLSAMTQTGTGLYLQDLEVGTGEAAATGDRVQVYYRGWLANGTLFDSRQAPSPPIELRLLPGQVIAGFGEGVRGMRVGGVRRLIIPPALGYGNQPQGIIPANSILVFEVELVAVT